MSIFCSIGMVFALQRSTKTKTPAFGRLHREKRTRKPQFLFSQRILFASTGRNCFLFMLLSKLKPKRKKNNSHQMTTEIENGSLLSFSRYPVFGIDGTHLRSLIPAFLYEHNDANRKDAILLCLWFPGYTNDSDIFLNSEEYPFFLRGLKVFTYAVQPPTKLRKKDITWSSNHFYSKTVFSTQISIDGRFSLPPKIEKYVYRYSKYCFQWCSQCCRNVVGWNPTSLGIRFSGEKTSVLCVTTIHLVLLLASMRCFPDSAFTMFFTFLTIWK